MAASSRFSQLRAEFRFCRYLLEQSSSHATCHSAGKRRNLMGKPASVFLVVARPIRHRLVGQNNFAPTPTAMYGVVLLMSAIAYWILQRTTIANQEDSVLAAAVGNDFKGKLSLVCYAVAIPMAFIHEWISGGLYVLVALIWLVPDRRIERALTMSKKREDG
jgi:uncharacterized membrane protein